MIFNSIINGGNSIDTSTLTAAPPQVLKDYKFIGGSGEIETGILDLFEAPGSGLYSSTSKLTNCFSTSSTENNALNAEFWDEVKSQTYPRFVHLGYYLQDPKPGAVSYSDLCVGSRTIALTGFTLVAVSDPNGEEGYMSDIYRYWWTGINSQWEGAFGEYGSISRSDLPGNWYLFGTEQTFNINNAFLSSALQEGMYNLAFPINHNNLLRANLFIIV